MYSSRRKKELSKLYQDLVSYKGNSNFSLNDLVDSSYTFDYMDVDFFTQEGHPHPYLESWSRHLDNYLKLKQNKMYNNNYNHNYNNGSYNYHQPYPRSRKKRSGAKNGITQKKNNHAGGKIWVNAWNYSRQRGLITASAIENKKSVKSKSKNGNRFVTMMFEIFYHNTGNTVLEVANYNVDSGKVYLEKIGMVISCQAPNGGYFGRIKRKK